MRPARANAILSECDERGIGCELVEAAAGLPAGTVRLVQDVQVWVTRQMADVIYYSCTAYWPNLRLDYYGYLLIVIVIIQQSSTVIVITNKCGLLLVITWMHSWGPRFFTVVHALCCLQVEEAGHCPQERRHNGDRGAFGVGDSINAGMIGTGKGWLRIDNDVHRQMIHCYWLMVTIINRQLIPDNDDHSIWWCLAIVNDGLWWLVVLRNAPWKFHLAEVNQMIYQFISLRWISRFIRGLGGCRQCTERLLLVGWLVLTPKHRTHRTHGWCGSGCWLELQREQMPCWDGESTGAPRKSTAQKILKPGCTIWTGTTEGLYTSITSKLKSIWLCFTNSLFDYVYLCLVFLVISIYVKTTTILTDYLGASICCCCHIVCIQTSYQLLMSYSLLSLILLVVVISLAMKDILLPGARCHGPSHFHKISPMSAGAEFLPAVWLAAIHDDSTLTIAPMKS